ncbi:3-hydroxyacyl-CoA dehydrogenase/enoyl-CoA hydratase family protein [Geosporobacter ferrireducens]|nr:3-hydroxyacyl-CoA dehydrogenase/enoyl-CoA hydratase family protein [Geosporobacter ferrireducens]
MKYNIKKAAVIGAGVMGAGIAAILANAGITVVLLDIVPKEFLGAEGKKRSALAVGAIERLLADKKLPAFATDEMAKYITPGNLEDDLSLISDCDWIIEVVAENLEIKHKLIERLLPHIKADAILSTNTSGIPVASIAKNMPVDLQKRFLGTHFFNPPRYMRLLEIIPTAETETDVIEYMTDFGYHILGKGVVKAHDTPNFIANRIGAVVTPLAFRQMKKYGFGIDKIDVLTGKLIGRAKSATFETADLVGLDVLAHVNNNILGALTDEEEKEYFKLPEEIRAMCENGQLGNKTDAGFYKRVKDENNKKIKLVWDFAKQEYVMPDQIEVPFIEVGKKISRLRDRLCALIYSDEAESKFLWENISEIIYYSAKVKNEVADDYKDIDNAMKWGYNWEVGPFELWDLIGFEKAALRMKADGKKLPEWVEERLVKKENFYERDPDFNSFESVYPVLKKFNHSTLLDLGDGVLGLEFKSPGDSITANIRKELVTAIDQVENKNQYKGLVLLNSGGNFLVGADLKEMITSIMAGQLNDVGDKISEFQQVSLRIKYARKPVIAAVHGMVLGGGCEFALQASRIVAHVDTYMGLVEVGVGLIPAGGGLKELVQRNEKLLKSLSCNDFTPTIQKLLFQVATAQVSKNAYEALQLGYLQPTDIIIAQIDGLTERAKEEVLRLAKDGFRQVLPKQTQVTGNSGMATLRAIIMGMTEGGFITGYDAEIAEKIAKVLTGGDVPNGSQITEQELLRLEKEGFTELIQNAKTHERISGMVKNRRPVRN